MTETPLAPLVRGESDRLPPDKGDRGGCSPSHGLTQIYTGDGKGKTSAALGTILRAVGNGLKVAVVYFDKGGDHYSERETFRQRFPEIEILVTGRDRIDPVTGIFDFNVTDEDRTQGELALTAVRRLFVEAKHDLIVLDEINSSLALGIVKETDVLPLIDGKPGTVELILTGRHAPQSLIDRADLVTEMKNVKHYFDRGITARKGFDF